MTNEAQCPVCGYCYTGRARAPERQRLASVIAVVRHAERTHGLDRKQLATLVRSR